MVAGPCPPAGVMVTRIGRNAHNEDSELNPQDTVMVGVRTEDVLKRIESPETRVTTPLVLTLHQGVLTLRAAMEQPETGRLLELVTVFERAWTEARRCAQDFGQGLLPDDPPSSSLPPA